jgi:hypothetical protein
MCQPYILSVGYTKSFLGNVSCRGDPAAFSNMWAYTYCSNFWSVIDPLVNVSVYYVALNTANTSKATATIDAPSQTFSGTLYTTRPALPGLSVYSSIATPTAASGGHSHLFTLSKFWKLKFAILAYTLL